jgi:hypothetical protein
MRDGSTVLGNMVLACQRCDHSKSQREFSEWMASDTPESPQSRGVADIPQRIDRIKAYVEQYGYSGPASRGGVDWG